MGIIKEKTLKFLVLVLIITGGSLYYVFFFTPKNSLELYQKVHFANDYNEVQKLMFDGYEDYFSEDDFNYIQDHRPNRVGQFTLFEYKEKSYVIMTSPGTERLKIFRVEELPEEIRKFFLDL